MFMILITLLLIDNLYGNFLLVQLQNKIGNHILRDEENVEMDSPQMTDYSNSNNYDPMTGSNRAS